MFTIHLLIQSIGFLAILYTMKTAQIAPFDPNRYPRIDFRMVDWPLVGPDNAAVDLDCYVQLDSEFVAKALLFKLHATARLSERPCAIRIPTGSRITVVEMGPVEEGHTSYVTVLAGPSQLFMPIRTKRIFVDHHELYGPWHVPSVCDFAYLMFHTRSNGWLKFRMEPEQEQDRQQMDVPANCYGGEAQMVVNYAEEEGIRWETAN